MRYSVETDYKLFLRNLRQYKWIAVLLFTLITLAITTAGFFMPKTYWSHSTLIIGGKTVIEPLMEGAAVSSSGSTDWAKVAKEFVYSRKNFTELMQDLGYVGDSIITQGEEGKLRKLKTNTTVELSGNDNYLKIGFKDTDPEFARSVASRLTNLFIDGIHGYRTEETAEAFEFINAQLIEYKEKLVSAETALKDFKTEKLEQGASSEEAISRRLDRLQDILDRAELDLREALIQKSSFERQLTGEVEETVSLARQSQHMGRLQNLNDDLAKLRLSYHETYPEIQSIKYQIADIKRQIKVERNDSSESIVGVQDGFKANKLYQDLKVQLSDVETRIVTMRTRIADTRENITLERKKGGLVHKTDARLAGLTRDYEVNQNLYEDLLKRREAARVSKEIGEQQRGMNVKVYEPAFLPVNPSGLRFIHFLAAGLLFGLLVPVTMIYFYQIIDNKVKSSELIASKFEVPILGTTAPILNKSDMTSVRARDAMWKMFLALSVGLVIAITFIKLFSG